MEGLHQHGAQEARARAGGAGAGKAVGGEAGTGKAVGGEAGAGKAVGGEAGGGKTINWGTQQKRARLGPEPKPDAATSGQEEERGEVQNQIHKFAQIERNFGTKPAEKLIHPSSDSNHCIDIA